MILNEIYNQEPQGFQDLTQDNSQIKMGELRKTRLTLRQIHKLRLMQDIRYVEFKDKIKLVKKQYSPPPQPTM